MKKIQKDVQKTFKEMLKYTDIYIIVSGYSTTKQNVRTKKKTVDYDTRYLTYEMYYKHDLLCKIGFVEHDDDTIDYDEVDEPWIDCFTLFCMSKELGFDSVFDSVMTCRDNKEFLKAVLYDAEKEDYIKLLMQQEKKTK